MSAHSQKAFTADKLAKMGISGHGKPGTAVSRDARANEDDYGKKAAGSSDSSLAFKRGGRVEGDRAKTRMDRPCRAAGGKVAAGAATDKGSAARGDNGMPETGYGERPERARGGRTKGKTQINIMIGDKGQGQPAPPPMPMPPSPPPQQPMRPMPPPPGMMPGMPPPGAMPPPGPGMPPPNPMMGRKSGGRVLSAGQRNKMPAKDFALPGRGEGAKGKGAGAYPIEDKSHARNALARVAQHGSSSEKDEVRAKVHAKYPDIGRARGGSVMQSDDTPVRKAGSGSGEGRLAKAKNEAAYARSAG